MARVHQVTISLQSTAAVLAAGELLTHGSVLLNDSVCVPESRRRES